MTSEVSLLYPGLTYDQLTKGQKMQIKMRKRQRYKLELRARKEKCKALTRSTDIRKQRRRMAFARLHLKMLWEYRLAQLDPEYTPDFDPSDAVIRYHGKQFNFHRDRNNCRKRELTKTHTQECRENIQKNIDAANVHLRHLQAKIARWQFLQNLFWGL